MNILQLTVDYPPPLTGGLPRQVHGLSHALTNRHEVAVVASGIDRNDGPIRVFGTDPLVDALPSHDMTHLTRLNFGLVRALVEAGRSGTWDIIHAHDWMVAPAALFANEVLGIPVVASIHTNAGSTIVGTPEDQRRRLDWESALAHVSSLLLAVSTPVERVLSARYPNTTTRYLPNGIDAARFVRSNMQRHPQRILFAGRLVPYKGCQDVIRAVALLRSDWPDLTLNIVGEGFYRPELEELAGKLGLEECITFLGWKDGEGLADTYAGATVIVVPSHEEAFGIVAIEAMAAGTPVIAS